MDHPSTAKTYNNIGLIYLRKGDFEKSLEFYLKYLKIDEQKFGIDHPSTATTYIIIGFIYSKKGDYNNSLEYYLKSLKIY